MRHALLRVALLATMLLLAAPALAQDLDLSGWTLHQQNSTQSFVIPNGTVLAPGAYLVVGRDVDLADFQAYHGTLPAGTVYLRSSNSVPQINGDETYTVTDAGGVLVDGPTPAVTTIKRSYHRADPEALAWSVIDQIPTPGSGAEPQDATYSGLVITEVTDPDDYPYEFLELYYDAPTGAVGDGPVIGNVQVSPAAPQNGDDVTVSCTATDPDGLVEVVWIYQRTTGGSFLPINMIHQGGGVYAHTFADMDGGTELQYYLWARDDSDLETLSPFNAPASYYSVYVDPGATVGKVVLFDHAHSQDSGSGGNWRVDDNHPLPIPSTPTTEASWSGQLSSWGFELFQAGHTIRSTTGPISSAVLADVDLLVIVEPQDPFTASEIATIETWVRNGGSLFAVANHNASDRNGNGWDSPSIFGGYSIPHIFDPVGSDTETFMGGLFGLQFRVKDEGNNAITGTFTNTATDPANPVLHGSYGTVDAVIYHVGTALSLWPTANGNLSDVGALISKDAGSPHVAAWSRYGQGKVVGYGDSSSCADGTDTETHEPNWTEVGSDNRAFFLNASAWLLQGDTASGVDAAIPNPGLDLRAAPNPFNPRTEIRFTLPREARTLVTVHDLRGRTVRTLLDATREASTHTVLFDGTGDDGRALPSGAYLVRIVADGMVSWTKVALTR
ncbi:hypothetical protein KDK88_04435 [bacterium]|nr:hypothetical protein [bacterium]